MFSYFYGGIKNIYPKRHIDLPTLVRLIMNNPEKFKIEKVRELRRTGMDYSTPKSYLPYITPNCLVKIRNLKESDYNLIAPSSYIYFDIDDYPNSQKLKDRFIEEYGHVASLICISCSGGGISIFFKVSNHLKNEHDFLIARQYIIDNILVNEKIDTNAGGIVRAMFISSDPDLFFNYENELEVPVALFKKSKMKMDNCRLEDKISNGDMIRIHCAPQEPFIPIPIKEVLEQLILETPVIVENPVVDYNEVNYVEIRFQYLIKDGLKHKTFTNMIHKLLFLNPSADKHLLLSYLYHVNEEYTGNKKMELRELIGLFETIYHGATFLGNSMVKPVLKRIHYNKDCDATFNKRKVSGKIRGLLKENETKLKIRAKIEEMEAKGIPISKSSISKHSGIHRGTIIKHMDTDLHDIKKIIDEINDSIE
jgi:VirE N-terminal domain